MVKHGPLCKGIEHDKGNILESELLKKQRMYNGAFLKSLSIYFLHCLKVVQSFVGLKFYCSNDVMRMIKPYCIRNLKTSIQALFIILDCGNGNHTLL